MDREQGTATLGVALRSANLLKMSLVTVAAVLAICLLALVETPNTALAKYSKTEEAADSRRYNGKIAFISYRDRDGALYTVEPDGSNPRQLINDTYVVDSAVWSPDGTKIAFSHSRKPSGFRHISVMNADGSGLRHLRTTKIRNSTAPTWSPDGTKLAFDAHLPGRGFDIFVMDPDGSNLNNLTGVGTDPYYDELAPAFSPDGKQICFVRATGTMNPPTGLYIMDADGSDPTGFVRLRDPDNLPRNLAFRCTWSLDGTKIAFTLPPPEHEVFVIDFRQRRFTNLTSNSAIDVWPDWSPNGKKIAFASDRDGDYDIYTMDADGSDVAQVTNLPGDEYVPNWQPLPRPTPPDTGGPSLLLVASALFFSGGSLLYAVVRRRM